MRLLPHLLNTLGTVGYTDQRQLPRRHGRRPEQPVDGPDRHFTEQSGSVSSLSYPILPEVLYLFIFLDRYRICADRAQETVQ